jgi:hypothetical protein
VDQAFNEDYFDYLYGIVITGAEWHFIIYTPDGIYCTSGSKYQINLTKSAIKENSELLRSNVKRVIGIIVGLLKDRVSVSSSQLARGSESKKLSKNNSINVMYHGRSPEHLYLFFAYINKKNFLCKFQVESLNQKTYIFLF